MQTLTWLGLCPQHLSAMAHHTLWHIYRERLANLQHHTSNNTAVVKLLRIISNGRVVKLIQDT